eukprot:g8053.t1
MLYDKEVDIVYANLAQSAFGGYPNIALLRYLWNNGWNAAGKRLEFLSLEDKFDATTSKSMAGDGAKNNNTRNNRKRKRSIIKLRIWYTDLKVKYRFSKDFDLLADLQIPMVTSYSKTYLENVFKCLGKTFKYLQRMKKEFKRTKPSLGFLSIELQGMVISTILFELLYSTGETQFSIEVIRACTCDGYRKRGYMAILMAILRNIIAKKIQKKPKVIFAFIRPETKDFYTNDIIGFTEPHTYKGARVGNLNPGTYTSYNLKTKNNSLKHYNIYENMNKLLPPQDVWRKYFDQATDGEGNSQEVV